MLYAYRVETVCAATIREVWTVQSSVPLSRGMLAQAFATPGDPGPEVTCVEDATSVTEGERVVLVVEAPYTAPSPHH